jgi:hypothetical protein
MGQLKGVDPDRIHKNLGGSVYWRNGYRGRGRCIQKVIPDFEVKIGIKDDKAGPFLLRSTFLEFVVIFCSCQFK